MGGRALLRFNVETVRKDTDDFNKIGKHVRGILFANGLDSAIARCYREKLTHGDLDVLIYKNYDDRDMNLIELIKREFNTDIIHTNGGVYSFSYDDFQIDFIPIPAISWDIANAYFSYDPLGNLMGKIYHKFNLSYGHLGLFYKYRDSVGRYSKDILVSLDLPKIFKLGGFDYDRFLDGFNTMEEIFEYVIQSKYFNSEIFSMNNLSRIDRKRNKKRNSYRLFLEYISNVKSTMEIPFESNKDIYLPIIDKMFSGSRLLETINELKAVGVSHREIANKFNGNTVMEYIPELSGKELGISIGNFRKVLGNDFFNFIKENEISVIMNKFREINNNNLAKDN